MHMHIHTVQAARRSRTRHGQRRQRHHEQWSPQSKLTHTSPASSCPGKRYQDQPCLGRQRRSRWYAHRRLGACRQKGQQSQAIIATATTTENALRRSNRTGVIYREAPEAGRASSTPRLCHRSFGSAGASIERPPYRLACHPSVSVPTSALQHVLVCLL